MRDFTTMSKSTLENATNGIWNKVPEIVASIIWMKSFQQVYTHSTVANVFIFDDGCCILATTETDLNAYQNAVFGTFYKYKKRKGYRAYM